MKRCPECRRDYYDDRLIYCLEDGAALIQGSVPSPDEPATAIVGMPTEPQTKILPISTHFNEKTGRAVLNRTWVIAGTITIALAAALGIAGYIYLGRNHSSQINSIAVLPFQNRNGDTNSEYLSDGLAESLIYRLSQLPNLKVSPTSSVVRYKGKDDDVATIANQLGVDAVMTGRLSNVGDNLKISVELVDARNNKLLWGEQYERKMSELLTTQREIATTIVDKLQLKLSGEAEQKLAKKYTENNEAYQLYLKGRFFAVKRTAKDARQALEYYQQAIDLDPNFALAFSGLSEANWFLAIYSYPQLNELIPKARELALKAIALDPGLAEPHSLLGALISVSDHDLAAWDRETKISIELNPNFAEGHRRRGLFLRSLGRLEDARVSFQRALELDPLSPAANFNYAELLYLEGKYDESEARSKQNIDLDPNFWYAHKQLHELYRRKRDYPSAVEELAKMQEARGEPDAAALMRESFTKTGWIGFLKAVTAQPQRAKLYPYFRASFYVELGDKEGAFAALNEALEEKDQHIVQYIKVDPYMEPLRSDPRYDELLKQLGLQ